MDYRQEERSGRYVITPLESINFRPNHVLLTAAEALSQQDPPSFVLDFSKLELASSVVLNFMLQLHARSQERGGQVVITGLSMRLFGMFRRMKLDQLLKIYPSLEAALAAEPA
jgi:anti-anti-sigma factor